MGGARELPCSFRQVEPARAGPAQRGPGASLAEPASKNRKEAASGRLNGEAKPLPLRAGGMFSSGPCGVTTVDMRTRPEFADQKKARREVFGGSLSRLGSELLLCQAPWGGYPRPPHGPNHVVKDTHLDSRPESARSTAARPRERTTYKMSKM